MKTSLRPSAAFWKNRSLILAGALCLLLQSCARKMTFGVSPVVPSAQGKVALGKDENKNTTLELRVRDLAPPDRLTPPKKVYVVWIETKDNGMKNLGQLNARRRDSYLKALSPFEPVRVFITAEDNAATSEPGTVVVMDTKK